MSQHDFNIANATASVVRTDLNAAFVALAEQSSGATAPTTTYANQMWYETDTNWLFQRNEANSAWIRFAYLDQAGSISLVDNTKMVAIDGTQTGLLGDQTTATWVAGTGTLDSLVSPAQIKAAVIALAPTPPAPAYEIAAWGEVDDDTDKVHGGNFDTVTGNSNGAVITFDTNLADTTYSVIATPIGGDVQGITTKSISSKTVSGFTIRFMTARSGSDTTCQFTWQVVRST